MATLLRIIAGHNNLNKGLHKQRLTIFISPKCDLCLELTDNNDNHNRIPEETTLHILEECPLLAKLIFVV